MALNISLLNFFTQTLGMRFESSHVNKNNKCDSSRVVIKDKKNSPFWRDKDRTESGERRKISQAALFETSVRMVVNVQPLSLPNI